MAGGALESRPAGTCRGHEKCAPGHRPWDGSGDSTVEHRTGGNFVPLAHGYSIAGCAGHDGRDAFDHGHLRNGCLLGEQATQGVGNSRGSRRATQGSLAGRAGTCVQTVGDWFDGGIGAGNPGRQVLASIVYQATSRDPVVLVGVVLAMAALGLLATWIPAQRALSVNPLILLRE